MALIMAGVGGGSSGSGATSGGRSAETAGGASGFGFGLFFDPAGRPRFFFAGSSAGVASIAAGFPAAGTATGSGATSTIAVAAAPCPDWSDIYPFLQACFKVIGPTNHSAVQVDAEAQAGAPKVDHVAVEVGELKAQVPQRDRAPDVDHVVLMRVRLHDVAHALLADDLGDDVVAQRPHRVGRVGQAAAAKVDLRVRLHLHEGEDLLVARLVDEAGAQQVVDAQGLAGRGALRLAAAPWKLGAQFLIVQDQPVAVVGYLELVARLHIGGAGEVAADPGGYTDGELSPVQRAQGGVLPGRCRPP